ncbi:MAG: GNAT family N-acetyltransferase [Planctomycetota bacterium]
MKIYYLEMLAPDELRPKPCDDPEFHVLETAVPQWQLNRFLYQWVGGDYQWIDRLSWTAERWRAYVADENLRTFIGTKQGSPVGYFELHKEPNENVEIAYFGLTPEFIGHGYGGAMLTEAIRRAWQWGKNRVWVHTCTRDHPAALSNYQARGMTIFKVENKK